MKCENSMPYSEWSTVNLIPSNSQEDHSFSQSPKEESPNETTENQAISTRKFVFEPSPVLKKRDHTYTKRRTHTVTFKAYAQYKYVSEVFSTQPVTAVSKSMFEGSPKMYRRFGNLERYAT